LRLVKNPAGFFSAIGVRFVTPVKTSAQLTLRDRLSRLTFEKACSLLGPREKS
jgi:hypothetical protein